MKEYIKFIADKQKELQNKNKKKSYLINQENIRKEEIEKQKEQLRNIEEELLVLKEKASQLEKAKNFFKVQKLIAIPTSISLSTLSYFALATLGFINIPISIGLGSMLGLGIYQTKTSERKKLVKGSNLTEIINQISNFLEQKGRKEKNLNNNIQVLHQLQDDLININISIITLESEMKQVTLLDQVSLEQVLLELVDKSPMQLIDERDKKMNQLNEDCYLNQQIKQTLTQFDQKVNPFGYQKVDSKYKELFEIERPVINDEKFISVICSKKQPIHFTHYKMNNIVSYSMKSYLPDEKTYIDHIYNMNENTVQETLQIVDRIGIRFNYNVTEGLIETSTQKEKATTSQKEFILRKLQNTVQQLDNLFDLDKQKLKK